MYMVPCETCSSAHSLATRMLLQTEMVLGGGDACLLLLLLFAEARAGSQSEYIHIYRHIHT